jgi:hypothetical protein
MRTRYFIIFPPRSLLKLPDDYERDAGPPASSCTLSAYEEEGEQAPRRVGAASLPPLLIGRAGNFIAQQAVSRGVDRAVTRT